MSSTSLLRTVATSVALALASLGAAQAATSTITFNTASAAAASQVFVDGALTLTVTGLDGAGAAANVTATTAGLGVAGAGMNDHLNHGESLVFTFNQAVLLTGFSLLDTVDTKPSGNKDANDATNALSLFVGNSVTPIAYTFGGNLATAFSGLALPSSTTFRITSADSLQISSLSFEAAPIAAVPEAQTYALVLAGLGVVGFSLRRKMHA